MAKMGWAPGHDDLSSEEGDLSAPSTSFQEFPECVGLKELIVTALGISVQISDKYGDSMMASPDLS